MPHVQLSSLPLEPQALPSLREIALDKNGMSAWEMILEAEKDGTQRTVKGSAATSDPLIAARVVGFFVLVFWAWQGQSPFTTAYHKIILDILSCNRSDNVVESIQQLGFKYRNFLIRPFRQNPGATPAPTSHPSRTSFEIHTNKIISKLSKFPKQRSDVKQEALLRDGYRCVISGGFDTNSTTTCEPVVKAFAADSSARSGVTQVAHLFSQTATDLSAGADALALMAMFGLKDTVDRLTEGQINSLMNVLTMNGGLHTLFDNFKFWLEEVPGQPYVYDVVARYDNSFFRDASQPKRRIILAVHEQFIRPESMKDFELPDRSLMAFRSACARVAVMSGAADQEDQILDDKEDICVLAVDGSDAEFLTTLLRNHIPMLTV